jgi:hypothetical protein
MNMSTSWSELATTRGAEASSATADHTSNPYEQIASELWSGLSRSASTVRDSLLPAPPKEISRTIAEAFSSIGDSTAALKSILATVCTDAAERRPAAAAAEKKTDWTVALNLTTDFDDDEDGRFYRLDDLREFAAKTKGKSLTIVVQAAFANEPDGQGKTSFTLERYIVRDGEIKQVSHGASKGYAEDLQDLMAYTTKNAPSDKLALIMDSHGVGNKGLLGDTGKVTLAEFVKRVEDGLKGSGREKLDLIHFDACLMAQNGAMDHVKKVADYMVASPETESTWGISLVPLWDKLAGNPKIDAREFGRELVRQARVQGLERQKQDYRIPIDTISHVDLRKYGEFRKSLDTFGGKLADSLKDGDNKALIEQAIDNSRKYGSGWTGIVSGGSWLGMLGGGGNNKALPYRVDLQDFANNIIKAIEDGRFKDDDRVIKKAAEELLRRRGDMVDSNYAHGKYEGTGGISVFLPARNMRNVEREARMMTSAGRLSEMSESNCFAAINKDDASRAAFVRAAKSEIASTKPFWILGVKGVDSELKVLEDAVNGFEKASSENSRRIALARVNRAAHNLELTKPFEEKQHANRVELRQKVSEVYKLQLVDEKDMSGWAKLRNQLKDNGKK